MQKFVVCSLLAFLLISPLNNPAYANGENEAEVASEGYDAIDKLARGTINLLVSPLEFLQGIGDAFSEHDIAVAWPVGLFNATWKTVKRAGVGVFEIVTFLFPQPANYGPIIEEPAFLGRKVQKEKEAKTEDKPTPDEELPIPVPGM